MVAADQVTSDRVSAVRAFNRFYTATIGALGEGFLGTPYSLAEARVLYELAQSPARDSADVRRALRIDAGYLSRILARFERRGLIERERSDADRRRHVVRLTARGREEFAVLDDRSRDEVEGLLAPLPEEDRRRLVTAMETVRGILHSPGAEAGIELRPPRSGDFGWVVQRHGVLYAREYGWDEHFEALVASIVARFIQHYDPQRERCWLAERDGAVVGCVFLVKQSKTVAKLRLLLVEPEARGLGIGTRLVDECVRFARAGGYRKVTLWTNDVLHAARHIYEAAGFRLVHAEPHHSFGHDLVGETWELKL